MTGGDREQAGLALGWAPRVVPLVPAALVAVRGVIPALHARLAGADDDALGRLRGVCTDDVWIVLGEAEDLPWVDGLTYLGRDPEAPSLWLPTYLEVRPPAVLVERALRARLGGGPLALFGTPPRLVGLGEARVLDRARMAEEARERAATGAPLR